LTFLIGVVVLAIVAVILVVGTVMVTRMLCIEDASTDSGKVAVVSEKIENQEENSGATKMKRDESQLELKETSYQM